MQTSTSGIAWAFDAGTGFRYIANPGPNNFLISGLDVPNGARLISVSLDACDTTDQDAVSLFLFRTGVGGNEVIGVISTGSAGIPGCGRFSTLPIDPPVTVDTENFNYWVEVGNGTGDGTTTMGSIRVYYQLQVSPPPGAATFGDVPIGHPFFQFVEALAASGITAGCGGGNYCPDNPLTRGQMAVFLAKALGLHWPTGGVN